jgi:hypothetical protein
MLWGMTKIAISIPRPGKLVRMHDGLYPGIIPRDIRRALNLSVHDCFQWQVEEDGLKLVFSQHAAFPRLLSPAQEEPAA